MRELLHIQLFKKIKHKKKRGLKFIKNNLLYYVDLNAIREHELSNLIIS